MVVIGQQTAAQLTTYCRSTLPEEACGVLEGFTGGDGQIHISNFIAVTNCALYPEKSFAFDAEEWVKLVVNSELRLIGTFHSHPTALAYPSRADLVSPWSNSFPVHLIIAMETGELFAYNQTKNHPAAARGSEWFNGLNIRINPPV